VQAVHESEVSTVTLPTPYTVAHERRVLGTRDAHGNARETWLPPVGILVHGWAPPSADGEPFESGRSPVVRDLDLYAPTGTVTASKDRITVDGVVYTVVGHPEDYSRGPWQWAAGVRINLKRVEG